MDKIAARKVMFDVAVDECVEALGLDKQASESISSIAKSASMSEKTIRRIIREATRDPKKADRLGRLYRSATQRSFRKGKSSETSRVVLQNFVSAATKGAA